MCKIYILSQKVQAIKRSEYESGFSLVVSRKLQTFRKLQAATVRHSIIFK